MVTFLRCVSVFHAVFVGVALIILLFYGWDKVIFTQALNSFAFCLLLWGMSTHQHISS
jgi:hypothetical protein